jgi:hypothetical protein
MKTLVDTVICCEFDEIKKQVFPMNKMFGLLVIIDNVKYEFLLNLKSTEKILVIGSGARNPNTSIEDKKRPLFHRWSWNFMQSVIFYNDPTTYLSTELLGGWGLGTCEDWYLKNISLILEEIFKNLSIDNSNVIFYGSSLGGFNSLMLSILMKNTISIAEIPQFDITKWSYHWNELKKYCFNDLPEEVIKEEYGYKIDVIELIKQEQYIPNAHLILDCSHDYDFQNIYLPFFSRLDELPFSEEKNRIRIRIDGKNKGHSFLDYESVITLIDNVISVNDNSYNENKDKKIEELEFLLKDKENEINKLNVQLAKKMDIINEKTDMIRKLEEFKINVLNSNSWKYTKFLRKIRK